ncbi:26S protease regulatory subunit 7 [Fasciola gigantica]|uniref:26S protease regulatory subunit 7 n=1 Tax=Fasciola gigantica TaxID=46835 RepID=A0A504Z8G7_FASGI|nr:26S protease regulatory subunit 7 [Fasciola gigantica]
MVLPADIEEGMRVEVGRNQRWIILPSPLQFDLSVTMTQVEYKLYVTRGNVGGCEKRTKRLRDIVERPCLHLKKFANQEAKPPKDVLLFGVSRYGKALRARVVTNGTGGCLIRIIDSELEQNYFGKTVRMVLK